MNEVLLRAHGLAKKFGRVTALRRVDLELKQAGLTVFLGENGAGKTTTLKIILGFLFPDQGRVEKRRRDLRLGYVPEQPVTFPWLKGGEVLNLTAGLFGLSSREAKRRVEELADYLSFDLSLLDRRSRTYSHGNQKKLAYLQSLLIDPELLIVDEPFTALDPVAIKQVREIFRRFKNQGKTIFLSSHLISEAEKLADQVVIIRRGETVFQADWNEFRQDRLFLKAMKNTLAERFCREHWPGSQEKEEAVENFVPKKQWNELLGHLEETTRQQVLKDITLSEPDLETLFLFLTR